MVRIENLSKTYKTRSHVLSNLNLHIKKGEYVEIVGKSGAGKSTLLNIIGLLDDKYSGDIFIGGQNVTKMNDAKVSYIRNRHIGFIFQAYQLISHMTAYENIMLPIIYSQMPLRDSLLSHVNAVIEKLGIDSFENQKIQYLSGGEKQRIAIARALSLSPELVLADEPTGNLDQANSEVIFSTLSDLNKTGVTVILVTHNRHIDTGATKTLTLAEGTLLYSKSFV